MTEFLENRLDKAKVVTIAKRLAQDTELVDRYRTLLAELPEFDLLSEIDPTNPALIKLGQLRLEVHEMVRGIDPTTSILEVKQAARYFAEWARGFRTLP